MKMKLSKSAWHYKLNVAMKRDVEKSVDFCGYFWKTVTSVIASPFLVFFFFLNNKYEKCKQKIRLIEVKKADKFDIISSFVHYRNDRRKHKNNTVLWVNYLKSINKGVWDMYPDNIMELRPFIEEFNEAPTVYTKGTMYRMVEHVIGALFFAAAIMYTAVIVTVLVMQFNVGSFENFFPVLGILSRIVLNGFLGVFIVCCIQYGVEYYQSVRKEKNERPYKEKNPNNPIEFVKSGYRSFKEKTCHKIEWET